MPSMPSTDSDGAAGHVLIVDDDEDIRDAMCELLRDEGYAVLAACDGVGAMDILLSSAERLVVLLDLLMPRLSGLDVLTLVIENAELMTRHTFIVVTANKSAADSPSAVDPYFASLLDRHQIPVVSKPFNITKLLELVAEASSRLT